jgi:hypothetical protein
MFNNQSKPIDLSESINLAMETLRQALELYFGKKIVFVNNVHIEPRRVRDYGDGCQARDVTLGEHFLAIDSDDSVEPTPVYASIELSKGNGSEDGWQAVRLQIGLGDLDKRPITWLWAHVIGSQRLLPTLKVCNETGHVDFQKYWAVGRTIADRHFQPIDFKGWGEV